MKYDYIIVGAGSAGCILANRLSADADSQVLIIEAGIPDSSPYIQIPKGFGKLLYDPKHCWYYDVEPQPGRPGPEKWIRGRTLGGSSSINGELYHRGQPEDFEDWKALGNTEWGWDRMREAFLRIEGHSLGGNEFRGGSGALGVSVPGDRRNPINAAFITAATEMGIPYKEDFNGPGNEGVGYFPQSVKGGRRSSTSSAFLNPAKRRKNLTIRTNLNVDRVTFEGTKATAVVCRDANGREEVISAKEIILAAGAINSPKILQLSGVGAEDHLAGLGIPVVKNLPGVGQNLLEHMFLRMQYRLKVNGSMNRQFSGWRLWKNAVQYVISRGGPLAAGAFDIGLSMRSSPELERPDMQINMYAASLVPGEGRIFEREPGMQIIAYPMRPLSQGSVMISSTDPSAPPTIHANYLEDEYDRSVSVRIIERVRELFEQPALKQVVAEETVPGASVVTSEEILSQFLLSGGPCLHGSSTCRMGLDENAVVGPDTRIRGLQGLRVVDCAIMPSMVSGNTNAPVMAMAWNAADIILAEDKQPVNPQ